MIYFDLNKLNKSVIQALIECLDLMQNGWICLSDVLVDDVWIVVLRKPSTGERIKIRIFRESYDIWRNGVLKKIVGYKHPELKN